MPQVSLATADAIELAELLSLVNDWVASDRDFLLGGHDGGSLFNLEPSRPAGASP